MALPHQASRTPRGMTFSNAATARTVHSAHMLQAPPANTALIRWLAFGLLAALLATASPLLAQHQHNGHDHSGHDHANDHSGHDHGQGGHEGHGHPALLMEDLAPLEDWSFEAGEGLEPTRMRFVHLAGYWVLQPEQNSGMPNMRLLPFGIPESGLEAQDLDPHKTYVVEGQLGIVPANIRMIGTPLKVNRILLLERAQQEGKE